MVVGEGLMAEGASQQLSAEYNVIRRSDLRTEYRRRLRSFLCCTTLGGLCYIARPKSAKGGRDSLASRVCIFGEGVIGPLVYPSESGCSNAPI
ncbi:hypothetical protein PO124_31130 [Bacillus licheniformis]|nr:hypothetical protein [Bacillus licheniformis]